MAVKLKGTIRQRGDKFEYVIDVGKHPVTGKRMQQTGIVASKDEAEKALVEINKNLRLGQRNTGITLTEFINTYYENHVKHNVRETTLQVQLNLVKRITDYFGAKKIDKLTYEDIEKFYHHLLNDRGMGKGTIRNISAILRKTFKYAMNKRVIIHDVSQEVSPYSYKPKRINPWNSEQVRHFLQCMEGSIRYPFYTLAFSTGMRIGEIAGLQKNDLMPGTNQLRIVKAVKYTKQRGHFLDDVTKTDNSMRTIKLPGHVVSLLEDHIKSTKQFMFEIRPGDFLVHTTIRRHFYEDIEKSGLPRIRLHDMRHTVATMLLMRRHPIVAVAELLGDTVETINSTYAHFIPRMESELVETISEEFFSPKPVDNFKM